MAILNDCTEENMRELSPAAIVGTKLLFEYAQAGQAIFKMLNIIADKDGFDVYDRTDFCRDVTDLLHAPASEIEEAIRIIDAISNTHEEAKANGL